MAKNTIIEGSGDSATTLILEVINKTGIEQYINVSLNKQTETRFKVEYVFDEVVLEDIDKCKNKTGVDEDLCWQNKSEKYDLKMNWTDFKKAAKKLDKYVVKQFNSSKIKLDKTEIDLNVPGYFYVDFEYTNEEGQASMIGEQIEIGENTLTLEVVEATNSVGRYPAIALDTNGKAHVAHYDATNTKVRYCNNTGGSWGCEFPDSTGDSGLWPDIALDSNNKVHIVHYDFTLTNLRYCNNTGGSWGCEIIESNGDVGNWPKIAIDSSDKVHITHFNDTGNDIRYCNNTGGSWTCADITQVAIGALHSSDIAIDSNGMIHVVQASSIGSAGKHCNSTDGGTWTCQNLYSVSLPLTGPPEQYSMFIDTSDNVHVGIRELFGGVPDDYRHRYCVNTGAGSSFTCEAVYNTAWDSGGHFPGLVTDKYDKPHTVAASGYSGPTYANKTSGSWTKDTSWFNLTDGGDRYGKSTGRQLAMERGRLSTSTTYDGLLHYVYYNVSDTSLGYATQTIYDTTPPTWSNHTNNASTTTKYGGSVTWTVDLADDTNLSWYYFAHNASGTMTNVTNASATGTSDTVSATVTINAIRGTNVCGQFYFNDTEDNTNTTNTSCFTVANTAPTTPTLISPDDLLSTSENYIVLKYNSTDVDNATDTMWFYIYNSTSSGGPFTLLFNGTGAGNSTYNWTGLTSGDYYWYVIAGDTFDNSSNSSTRKFTVSLNAPSINLNWPTNVYWFNTRNISYFNFTATDGNGLDECQLWHNLSGTWHKNQTTTSAVSGTMFSFNQTENVTNEKTYIWNIWCNDTTGESGFSSTNLTFYVDSSAPVMNISNLTTTLDSQTFTFDTNYSDYSISSCFYSIFDSVGAIDGIYENISISCGQTGISATVSAYGNYTLTLYGKDTATNVGSVSENFTVSQTTVSPGGGGGGGGGQILDLEPVSEPKFETADPCGDGVCEAGENPLDCPQDCRLFSLDEMFCLPLFQCGNWNHTWFINIVVIAVTVGVGYSTYRGKTGKGSKGRRPRI